MQGREKRKVVEGRSMAVHANTQQLTAAGRRSGPFPCVVNNGWFQSYSKSCFAKFWSTTANPTLNLSGLGLPRYIVCRYVVTLSSLDMI